MKKLSQDQINKIYDLEEARRELGSIVSNHFSGRYVLSSEEWAALPKLSKWERDFVGGLFAALQFDALHRLSEKQEACLDRILNKINGEVAA